MLNQLSNRTNLISLYIPPRRPIVEVIGQLMNEYNIAQNIKSNLTRNNVQDALTKIIEYLKVLKQTPQNGLAVFCGATFCNTIEVFTVSPSKPIVINLYRCDDHFYTESLVRDSDLLNLSCLW